MRKKLFLFHSPVHSHKKSSEYWLGLIEKAFSAGSKPLVVLKLNFSFSFLFSMGRWLQLKSSNNLRQRMYCYLSLAFLTSHKNYLKINRALLKYGFASFVLLIFEETRNCNSSLSPLAQMIREIHLRLLLTH